METNLAHIFSRAALPIPARDLYSLRATGYSEGVVSVSIDLPEQLVFAFTALLDSLSDSFRFLQFKAKCVKAEAKVHDPIEIERREKVYQAYQKKVVSCYDKFFSSGLSVRESIRKTKAHFLARDEYITCSNIELIIRWQGRLSKKYLGGRL